MRRPVALIILDGFGCSETAKGNALLADGAKNITALWNKYPHTKIAASGLAVGLPEGQMGNSEVGHLNIGAGRIVYQDLTRITKSIQDGDFFKNEAFLKAMENCRQKGTALHLMGLCSDGGVHSHLRHAYALVRLARKVGLRRVYLHCFMDGRDVSPTSGRGYLKALQSALDDIGCGQIATVMGRYYAMDRDNRYERVRQAYAAMVYGEGRQARSADDAIAYAYAHDETDEFIKPTVIMQNGAPATTIREDDGVIFFNFRPDRAREITRALLLRDFDGFERRRGWFPLCYVSMTQYDKTFEGYLDVAYKPETLINTLGEYLGKLGKTQLRIAETEKYAHVTFFFNGGMEAPNIGEDRHLIPSPKVATYDLKPEMSAYEVAEEAVRRVREGSYDVIIVNFANSDMVGHTGVMEAAVAAVHAVDACTARVAQAVLQAGGHCLITADHGNAECMIDPVSGGPFTAHTTNPVPLIVVDPDRIGEKLRDDGKLADLAPTLLSMMGLPIPKEMTGKPMFRLHV
ncbi:MAG: 2,3-bisphosphoglycerate-independent phosphoglycerate mutase [Clostridiales bacterium]|jgi:2,3-bisphosphoglycerate-independent phosphoglycerate mutase|nr:2,3-bisphosphoglycerate-independent phosphoglycerate mutase [Clostridiales bacterium]